MAKTSTARATPPSAPKATVTRIVSHAPAPPPKPERNLAGRYRVIHGNFWIPRDRELTHNADGSRKENEPIQELAKPGAVLDMSHEDARSALLDGTVEEMDASPSRVGKVYEPGEPHDNSKQAKARIAQNLSPLVRDIVAAKAAEEKRDRKNGTLQDNA